MSWDAGVLVVGTASIAVFVLAFQWSGLLPRVQGAVAVARQTLAVIASKTLDDEDKERLVQRAALRLFGQFALITLISLAVLATPGVVIWVGDLVGLASVAAVVAFLSSWQVIVGASVLILAAVWVARRR